MAGGRFPANNRPAIPPKNAVRCDVPRNGQQCPTTKKEQPMQPTIPAKPESMPSPHAPRASGQSSTPAPAEAESKTEAESSIPPYTAATCSPAYILIHYPADEGGSSEFKPLRGRVPCCGDVLMQIPPRIRMEAASRGIIPPINTYAAYEVAHVTRLRNGTPRLTLRRALQPKAASPQSAGSARGAVTTPKQEA